MRYHILLILFIAAIVQPAEAQRDKRISIGFYDTEPWVVREKDGNLRGIGPEYVKLISLAKSYKIDYIPIPYSPLFHKKAPESLDAVHSFYHPNLSNHFDLLSISGRVEVQLITNLKKKDIFRSPDNAITIALLRGSKEALIKNGIIKDWWNIVETKSDQQAMLYLKEKRVDGIIIPNISYDYHIEKYQYLHDLVFRAYDLGYIDILFWVKPKLRESALIQDYKESIEIFTHHGEMTYQWWKMEALRSSLIEYLKKE